MLTIAEMLIREISWNADFAVAGVRKGDIKMMITSMHGVRVLCQFGKKLVTRKYLEVGAWGNAVTILNRVARDLETVRMGYDGWNKNNDVVQDTLDEIEELTRLIE